MKLELSNLNVATKSGQRLVNNVNLTIEQGSVLALVGASGSGKSITCSALFDVLPANLVSDYKLLLNGKLTTGKAIRGRQLCCIMQNPASAFNPVQTMHQHCKETLAAAGIKDHAVIRQAMLDAGLEDWPDVLKLYPFQMSGGMLQRMMLALALMSNAPILIADEPTTDLDLVVQRHILDQLKRVCAERNLALMMVTHDLGVVAELADRVAIMDGGEMIEYAAVEDFFRQPKHDVSRQLLGAHYALYPNLTEHGEWANG